jgi:hypothetical protein
MGIRKLVTLPTGAAGLEGMQRRRPRALQQLPSRLAGCAAHHPIGKSKCRKGGATRLGSSWRKHASADRSARCWSGLFDGTSVLSLLLSSGRLSHHCWIRGGEVAVRAPRGDVPATSASRMSRPHFRRLSAATQSSLIPAFSSALCSRLTSWPGSWITGSMHGQKLDDARYPLDRCVRGLT